jgi:methanogenic corrinoid protein MtbC1
MAIQGAAQLAAALDAVDARACDDYAHQAHLLIDYVNKRMLERTDLIILLGQLPLDVLYASHAEHAHLFERQLRLKSAAALIDLFAWVYKTHLLRGVPLNCFPLELALWSEALDRYLDPTAGAQIKQVYHCLQELHPQLVLLAHNPHVEPEVTAELLDFYRRFLAALLKPDAEAAIKITGEYVKGPAQIPVWWESVIQPSLYEIGYQWARGEITVGQEHMATAITQRVMALYYPMILELPRNKGRIVVTASPGEFHEIGTRIVADLLEVNGWDVYCTGANTPTASVIMLLEQTEASILCISTTLPSSLPAVTTLIADVRAAKLQRMPKIIVGGQAYRSDPDIWRRVGADGFGTTAHEGIALIEGERSTAHESITLFQGERL